MFCIILCNDVIQYQSIFNTFSRINDRIITSTFTFAKECVTKLYLFCHLNNSCQYTELATEFLWNLFTYRLVNLKVSDKKKKEKKYMSASFKELCYLAHKIYLIKCVNIYYGMVYGEESTKHLETESVIWGCLSWGTK